MFQFMISGLTNALQNILTAKAPNEVVTFIHPDDLEMFNKWENKAFELQVANHELLGHGTGKLFQEDAEGKLNFNPEKVQNESPVKFDSHPDIIRQLIL